MIRVGIGGWTYEPWRGPFYPEGHPKARELEFASRAVTAIEINGTFYSRQKPATWADWAARVPDDFVFAVKASRFCVNRRVLAEAGEGIASFLDQGLAELGPKLGPILWQFPGTKQFDPDDFARFLDLLPAERHGLTLRHALEPRHESFKDPRFLAMARERGMGVVIADSPDYPQIADLTGPFVYARLQDAREDEVTGYSAAALDGWAETAQSWASGHAPEGLAYVEPRHHSAGKRDVFVFMINGAKVRAPAAARALIERVSGS